MNLIPGFLRDRILAAALPGITERITAHAIADYKKAALQNSTFLPVVSSRNLWNKTNNFQSANYQRLGREGYKANSAVFGCITAYCFSFPEPPLIVVDENNSPLPDHRAQAILQKPNDDMDEFEFKMRCIFYACLGGACYVHIGRSQLGAQQLFPYPVSQLSPVPSEDHLIHHYRFTLQGDRSQDRDIPADEIIRLNWPAIDPDKPWLPLSPLMGIAREIDTDTEMTRYIYALIKNDAIPSTLFSIPKPDKDEEPLTEPELLRIKAAIVEGYGGDSRGGPMVAEGGVRAMRLSNNLKELASDALRKVSEDRITTAYRIPAVVAGLTSGDAQATYANVAGFRKQWTEETLSSLWAIWAGALTRGIIEPTDTAKIIFDTSKVKALQESENEAVDRRVKVTAQISAMQTAYNAGAIRREDAIAAAVSALGISTDKAEELFAPIEVREVKNELRSTVGGAISLQTLVKDYEAGLISQRAAIALAKIQYDYDEITVKEFFSGEVKQLQPDNKNPVTNPAGISKTHSNGHAV